MPPEAYFPFVDAWLADPVKGPTGKEINFKGFAIGDGFPACIPLPGRRVDWCVDLNNVEFFKCAERNAPCRAHAHGD